MSTTHADAAAAKKEVWKITVYLSVITLVELALGYIMFKMNWSDGSFIKLFTKILILLFMLWKAFYIIAYFMHLKFEAKPLVSTLIISSLLFIWFIIAFLWDGSSYKQLRTRYTPYHVEHFQQPMPVSEAHQGGASNSVESHTVLPTKDSL